MIWAKESMSPNMDALRKKLKAEQINRTYSDIEEARETCKNIKRQLKKDWGENWKNTLAVMKVNNHIFCKFFDEDTITKALELYFTYLTLKEKLNS